MAKRISARRIKIHRQYTYDQAAIALGVSIQTVRGWRKAGLRVLSGKTPHLIIGADLKAFLDRRTNEPNTTLSLSQFRCMRCGTAVAAYGGMVDYSPLTRTRGVLSALCATCEGACTKFVNQAQVDELSQILSVKTRNSR